MPVFMSDIATNDFLKRTVGSPYYLIEGCNKGIQVIVNNHAPSSSRNATLRENSSWYLEDLRSGKGCGNDKKALQTDQKSDYQ